MDHANLKCVEDLDKCDVCGEPATRICSMIINEEIEWIGPTLISEESLCLLGLCLRCRNGFRKLIEDGERTEVGILVLSLQEVPIQKEH